MGHPPRELAARLGSDNAIVRAPGRSVTPTVAKRSSRIAGARDPVVAIPIVRVPAVRRPKQSSPRSAAGGCVTPGAAVSWSARWWPLSWARQSLQGPKLRIGVDEFNLASRTDGQPSIHARERAGLVDLEGRPARDPGCIRGGVIVNRGQCLPVPLYSTGSSGSGLGSEPVEAREGCCHPVSSQSGFDAYAIANTEGRMVAQ